jgi:flavin reductase (DIM6/NTAB) family NADH-FMN oxidoreductase RutF
MTELTTWTTRQGREATAQDQRSMMRGFPTGVAVVTAIDGADEPRGMTISSMCSVSLDPPTLLICLRSGSPTLDAIVGSGRFAVNLLHDGAQAVADLFASGAPDRFDRVRWEYVSTCAYAGGPHLFHDAHTIADCRVDRVDKVGDHTVVFGETVRVTENSVPSPLLYGMREYRSWPRS